MLCISELYKVVAVRGDTSDSFVGHLVHVTPRNVAVASNLVDPFAEFMY